MERYFDFLLKQDSTTFEKRQMIKNVLEKGSQVFGNNDEFNIWLNKSFFRSGKESFLNNETVDLNFIHEEIERLAQGYCA